MGSIWTLSAEPILCSDLALTNNFQRVETLLKHTLSDNVFLCLAFGSFIQSESASRATVPKCLKSKDLQSRKLSFCDLLLSSAK